MRKLALAVVVAGATSASVVGCHDSKDRSDTASVLTNIDIFDGYALGCTVTANGINGEEVGNGAYTITDSTALPVGAVISANGCRDADTNALLPEFKGVSQTEGAAISPITTLIVAAALAAGGDPANISSAAIETAKSAVVTNLNLGSYDPINPATANYVETVGTSVTSQQTMQAALAVSTLLKTVEKAAGDSSDAALTALAQAVVQSSAPINLGSTTAVQTLMTSAATIDSTVATVLNTASTAAAEKVAQIASADNVADAAAIVQAVAVVLNDTSATVESVAVVVTTDLPPIQVGVTTDPDTGSTGGSGGTGS